ncbi:BglG family transcription antiterminator [Bacillus ginsengihumi]|uniref:Ascorbate-specific PTS system EIIA component n=1 Tax=Heyndrickxia ginsengihumi TaxID=363870 RepID=A0A0A6V8U4_9BACI|nr:BglG family transcription antiterminator [Heyndrickxia ginsengihumi]KHD84490.1 transcription antiterminator BglG [Heyndrickxia ginsengihumi]NEY19305.1 BglG family transcription antiterminator [Heyndrickxia ginsengihumi]
MVLSIRNKQILNELVANPSIISVELEKKFNLTRRQLGYSINKINEWLITNNLPIIERTRQGYFIINEDIFITMNGESREIHPHILTEKQRVAIIIMMILSLKEELSLNHFAFELDVSKNTILNDLKHVQVYLQEYDLTIKYTRKDGYVIEGKEFQIRKLLIRMTFEILNFHNGKGQLKQITGIQNEQINEFVTRIGKLENKLSLKFTDEKLETMPFIFILILRRIKKGKIIQSIPIDYKELSHTKEYLATEEILFNHEEIPVSERIFITLHLLTTNVYWSDSLIEDDIPNLFPAIDNMLLHFEESACIYFQNREQLLDKLLQHIKPAYYRIKYHLNDTINFELSFSNEFKEIHHLVKRSIGSLEEIIGNPIPESEITYITMLIGGWMKQQGESIHTKVKAIVVCPQGISVSRLMFNELRGLFPEFIFLDSLSVREYIGYQFEYDIIFSSIFLETDKKLIVTKAFLDQEEKIRLRRQVMLDLYGFVPSEIDVNGLIEMIKNHCIIHDEIALKEGLQKYLHRDDQPVVKKNRSKKETNLSELIRKETIITRRSVTSWEEAIKVASKPLILNGCITENYVEAMIKNNTDPYIVISPNVAIPHAVPDDGVKKLAMSLLRLENGVKFVKDHFINLVVVVAAIDRVQHLRALTQLMKLVANQDKRNSIIQSRSPLEICNLLDKYTSQ